ncbi:aspartate 1-decarboxylase [Arcobacter porcinus]|uniref:Aspartate 1-decarboxylase n=1 Tax=Arcobacter porcinus TaxID=1935204 RepID=A0A1C0AZA2_9BACT|nr:aspartate 1-decarboxylase [Arcobacter porcinus]OCL94400.1 Aspartate 1-decarboxylase precursor [Aliarcobacter thereius]OCL83548.1 Aspartate 1-decarboxylase precursor [Arcobacter porcinus]OCL83767.1 Aspartate 1-decarboxylase precursor [Arcobacter porcinus]OCL87954.1 Aspartate 1-decarboxylase precursor [Arcobacter porcinus]OCL92760.1 Aspartate 1-decarboxylase precursor [Arcobacter porcinus]
MTFEMLYSKIHRATVSDANLNYVGSITIDEELMNASNLRVGQKVDIVNINNGERFQTYVIKGKFGQKDMCLNGAAARKVSVGDKIIVIAYATYSEEELKNYKPTVVLVDDKNNIELITNELVGSKDV